MLQKCFECAPDKLHERIWVDVASPEVACSPQFFPRWTMKRRYSRVFFFEEIIGQAKSQNQLTKKVTILCAVKVFG
jgi:hypothetical protein